MLGTLGLIAVATLGPIVVHDSRESSPLASVGTRPGTFAEAPVVYERKVGEWRQWWLGFAHNDQDRGIVRTGRHAGDWELVQVRDRMWPDPNDEADGRGATVVPPVEPLGAWADWPGLWGGARAGLVPGEMDSRGVRAFSTPIPRRSPAAPGRARSTAATSWANATRARSCCRSPRRSSPPWPSSGCAVGDHRGMPNIFNPEWEAELPGLRGQRVGAGAGGEKLGATLYEVDPGGRVSPLHIHHANEEMLFVVSGRPTLRTGDGERELEEGEVIAFPSGRRGVHQVLNRSGEPARVLIVSTMIYPEVAEHPDSGKVVAISGRPDETAAMFLAFRKGDAVPVTEGEG